MSTFLQAQDTAMRQLVFSRFGDALELSPNVFQDTVFFPKEIVLRKAAEARGAMSLEFLSLWRTGGKLAWDRQNTPAAKYGAVVQIGEHEYNVRWKPVDLSYSIWAWSKSWAKTQECVRSFIMWQMDVPLLTASIDLGDGNTTDTELYFQTQAWQDESPIAELYEGGVVYVSRMDLVLNGWELDIQPLDGGIIESIVLAMHAMNPDGSQGDTVSTDTITSE